MPKKPDKIKGSKIGGVKDVDSTRGVEEVRKVSEVDQVKSSSSVSKRKSTREMTWEEREKLFGLVKEEAKKLFGKSDIPAKQREVIERAVKIAIDASIPDDNDQDKKDKESN